MCKIAKKSRFCLSLSRRFDRERLDHLSSGVVVCFRAYADQPTGFTERWQIPADL